MAPSESSVYISLGLVMGAEGCHTRKLLGSVRQLIKGIGRVTRVPTEVASVFTAFEIALN